PWGPLGGFTLLAVGGILLGIWLTRFVSAAGLKRAFAVLLVLMGAFILYKNREELMAPSADTSSIHTLQQETSCRDVRTSPSPWRHPHRRELGDVAGLQRADRRHQRHSWWAAPAFGRDPLAPGLPRWAARDG